MGVEIGQLTVRARVEGAPQGGDDVDAPCQDELSPQSRLLLMECRKMVQELLERQRTRR